MRNSKLHLLLCGAILTASMTGQIMAANYTTSDAGTVTYNETTKTYTASYNQANRCYTSIRVARLPQRRNAVKFILFHCPRDGMQFTSPSATGIFKPKLYPVAPFVINPHISSRRCSNSSRSKTPLSSSGSRRTVSK